MAMKITTPSGVHMRRILLQCLFIAIPMLASSSIVIYIVYANLVGGDCPTEELCPKATNATLKGYYYVDFPAARLAFISSGSATVSFVLIGSLMTIHSYHNAASFLHTSEEMDSASLPSPYQLSLLLRALNAEVAVIWDLASSKVGRVFWDQEIDVAASLQIPPLMRTGLMVLMAGILASVFVQAADVYFHVAMDAIQLVHIEGTPPHNYQFSRGLASWCLNKPRHGNVGDDMYWGCAITAQRAAYNNATSLAATNASIISDMKNGLSDQHRALNFTDSSGVQYAIVGPATDDVTLDWTASSFGVSTACSAIPEGGCEVSKPITNAKDGRNNPVMLVPFNCSKETAGLDISGTLTSHNTATHTINFHKYAAETAPFLNTSLVGSGISPVVNGTENGNDVFKNGWSVLVMRKIPSAAQGDFSQLPQSFAEDIRTWKHGLLGAFMLLHCNVTVWDVTYKSVLSEVQDLSKVASNGSVAGMASMPGTRQIGTLANVFQDESTGPLSRSSPDNFIRSFELGMSRAYSYPLASQMSSRPSLLMQTRSSKVVTRLPIAALWFLVAANAAYALLGLVIAICAILKLTDEVGQVQIRLGVVGLGAALFNQDRFGLRSASSEGLLEQQRSSKGVYAKRIAVVRTEHGGSAFEIREK